MDFFQIICQTNFFYKVWKAFGKFNFGIGFWYLISDILSNNLEFYELELSNASCMMSRQMMFNNFCLYYLLYIYILCILV